MPPSTIENCPAILRMNEFLREFGFRIWGEGECGLGFHTIAIETNSRSNEMSRQQ
jgi:hypothetical protein